jgi:hypothetical protein
MHLARDANGNLSKINNQISIIGSPPHWLFLPLPVKRNDKPELIEKGILVSSCQ